MKAIMPEVSMQEYLSSVESYLNTCFSDSSLPQKQLFEAMRYSLLAGGKRIRPILTLEFSRLCGADWKTAMPFAAAVEMIHTSSLIHDDLPCMDDDDYRRGRLTNHKVFGEATAVLAGDALLLSAFSSIAGAAFLSPAAKVSAVEILACRSGELGMVGGQILDMEGEQRRLSAAEAETVHRLKTGCLISAACQLGVAAADGTTAQMEAACAYASALGLAFQIQDDLLDVLGDSRTLGKATHADESKTTFVTLYGVDACKKMVMEETERACAALDIFTDTDFLRSLALRLAHREN